VPLKQYSTARTLAVAASALRLVRLLLLLLLTLVLVVVVVVVVVVVAAVAAAFLDAFCTQREFKLRCKATKTNKQHTSLRSVSIFSNSLVRAAW
jgi:hypothetical protein